MPDTAPSPKVPELCLDCGTVVELEYCPKCGQHRGDYRRSTWRLLGEVFKETLEFDGRVWRTLQAMLRPGRLTREFNAGRRRRYMSPVRFYLLVSVVMFAAAGLSLRAYFIDQPQTPLRVSVPGPVELESAIPDGFLGRALQQRVSELSQMSGAEQARELVTGAVEQAPIVMFCLLPVFALLLKLAYVGRRWFYVDHLVFALHVHTVWFLLATIIIATAPLVGSSVVGLAGLLAVVYTTVAMQHAYSSRWWSTLLRAAIVGFAYTVVLSIGMALSFALGALLG